MKTIFSPFQKGGRLLDTAVILVASVIGTLVPVAADEVRSFTNTSGIQIQASLVDVVDGTMVTIRRVADGREFTIPISTLSLDDQRYIKARFKARTQPVFKDEGNTLVVLADSVMDNLAPFSSRLSRENFQVGQRTFRLAMPVGSWVCYQPEAFHAREFLVEYRGARSWEFEIRENEVWLTRGLEQPELIGINFPEQPEQDGSEEPEVNTGVTDEKLPEDAEESVPAIAELFEGIHNKRLGDPLSLALTGKESLEELDLLPSSTPLAINSRFPLSEETFEKLSSHNVVAAHIAVLDDKAARLSQFRNLNYLWIRSYFREEETVLELPEMPYLKHLVLNDLAGKVHWDAMLKGMPQLRSLLTMRHGRNSPGVGTPITTFAANPDLKVLGLYHYDEVYLKNDAFEGLEGLEWLWLDENVFVGDGSGAPRRPSMTGRDPSSRSNIPVLRRGHGPGIEAFFGMRNLRRLFLHFGGVKTEEFDRWAESGALDNLKDFGGRIVPNSELLPQLEYLELTSRASELPDFGRLSSDDLNLKILELSFLSNKDLEYLTLANPSSVVGLTLSQCSIDDPELLYRFNSLRNLEITSNRGRMDHLDLGRFSSLSKIVMTGNSRFERFENLASHPEMQYLYLSRMSKFNDLGIAAPNSTLRTVAISSLPSLPSLAALEATSGLGRLVITNCDRIPSVESIKHSNQLYYLLIRSCDLMPDEEDISKRPDEGSR